ncbi:latent-transforming growth factor beta-binding protein 4-like [Sycon ciliatum]|uniref:latent-transforming growth factor beta-binding protein 4-like n=1 Tax=Sycon ciliatum TaxID=27933 RepID=UPI0031F67431
MATHTSRPTPVSIVNGTSDSTPQTATADNTHPASVPISGDKNVVKSCEDPGPPANGSYTVQFEDFIVYSCNAGCVMVDHPAGIAAAQCLDNKQWSHPKPTCHDIDECTVDKGICKNGVNGQCNNTPGSYQCVCKPGFAGTPCAVPTSLTGVRPRSDKSVNDLAAGDKMSKCF